MNNGIIGALKRLANTEGPGGKEKNLFINFTGTPTASPSLSDKNPKI